MLKRILTHKMLMTVVMAALLAFAGSAMAQEEAKPPLLPPLTGPGSEQTYMQAVWVVIIFVILLAVLYPTAWKNVLEGLKKREERIRGDIAAAEVARSKAEATLGDYNKQLATAQEQVKQILSTAATDAERIASGIRAHAQQDAEEIKERALKEIETSKQAAITEIHDLAANLSTSVAEKILRRNLNADDQRDLVQESLRQLQGISV